MSDTGVFTKNLCDLYSVSAGAYTTITESELKRATFNVKKDIRELLILMIGKGNFSTPEDEIKHKIKFKILNDNREVELACYYAKRNKEEMSIYFTSEIINRYNIEPDDIWFVCSENDNSIPILGFAKKEKWKANFMNVEKLIEESLGIEGSGELEDDSDDDVGGNEQPFDADKIRIDQQMLLVKYIYELYQSKLLDTNPNFQRKPVWNELRRKSLLIESLMLRIPIPAFYFYENEDSLFQVIDGQQRLLTIFEYINDGFRLSNLEYLNDICGKRKFSELDIKYQQRIYRTQLAINILDARSPHRVIYDIFRRINTGGVNLTLQEMRNAICTQRIRDYLETGVSSTEYLEATRHKINDIRMDSQELFLRFIALYRLYDYQKGCLKPYYYSKISKLLDDEIGELARLDDNQLEEIFTAFKTSMKRCKALFGKYAFVKIYEENGEVRVKKDLINKALFMSVSVVLANDKYQNMNLDMCRERAIKTLAVQLQDKKFDKSISGGTGDRSNVLLNFEIIQEVIDRCVTEE